MLTARTDTITHLVAADLGFETVKAYAGEIAAAARAGGVITVPLPAALVLTASHRRTPHQTITALDVIVCARTPALDTQAGATEALALAEDLVATLRADTDYEVEGRRYVIQLAEGIVADTLAVAVDYTFVRVAYSVIEMG